jgi:hypothetical protein
MALSTILSKFESYLKNILKIDSEGLMEVLKNKRYMVSGSTALYFYLQQIGINPGFTPNDLDIYFLAFNSLECQCFKNFFSSECSEDELYYTNDHKPRELNILLEKNNYKEVENNSNNLNYLPVIKDYEFYVNDFVNNENKKIQIISISNKSYNKNCRNHFKVERNDKIIRNRNKILEFIFNSFDLNICMTWFDVHNKIFRTYDELTTNKKVMFIKNVNYITKKIRTRINKYLDRGFTLIETSVIDNDKRLYKDILSIVYKYMKNEKYIKHTEFDIENISFSDIRKINFNSAWGLERINIYYGINNTMKIRIPNCFTYGICYDHDPRTGNKLKSSMYMPIYISNLEFIKIYNSFSEKCKEYVKLIYPEIKFKNNLLKINQKQHKPKNGLYPKLDTNIEFVDEKNQKIDLIKLIDKRMYVDVDIEFKFIYIRYQYSMCIPSKITYCKIINYVE